MAEELHKTPDAMAVRAKTVEHPFGTLKAWMGATHFSTKRLKNVRTEMSLHVLAYNLRRMISIMGVRPLMEAIRAWNAVYEFLFIDSKAKVAASQRSKDITVWYQCPTLSCPKITCFAIGGTNQAIMAENYETLCFHTASATSGRWRESVFLFVFLRKRLLGAKVSFFSNRSRKWPRANP